MTKNYKYNNFLNSNDYSREGGGSAGSNYSGSSISTTTTTNNSINSDIMYIRDWRKALRSPPSYRVGNRTFRFHYHIVFMLLCLGSLILIFLYIKPTSKVTTGVPPSIVDSGRDGGASAAIGMPINSDWPLKINNKFYNSTYPLSPKLYMIKGMVTFHIGLIADLDQKSKDVNVKNTWKSYLKKGYLNYNQQKTKLLTTQQNTVEVTFNDNVVTSAVDPIEDRTIIELQSNYAHKGRGMELSELVTFDGRQLTFDDRTGIVYEIIDKDSKIIPWIILMDGDGRTNKGFKAEWATVKDQLLYVGSMGKEWTSSNGDFLTNDPMYIKIINANGEVIHKNWMENYKIIRSAIGIEWPGYMIHESCVWSPMHRKWFFLPRRCSKEKYNETRDEYMGCNVLISADEHFTNVQVVKLPEFKSSQGFSSFKFIPESNDNAIIALQSEEVDGKTSTYIVAFTIDGKIIMEQIKILTELKYEGIEFL